MGKLMASLIITIIGGVIVAVIVAYWHIGGSPGNSSSQIPISQQTSIQVDSSSSSPVDAETSNSVPSRQCILLSPSELSCISSDPEVTLDDTSSGDTSGCLFNDQIDWGDGTPVQSVDVHGGAPATFFVASHTYGTTGTFDIHVDETVTYGSTCAATPEDFTFTHG